MDPYLENLKARLAAAKARPRKDDYIIKQYEAEIKRVEKLAGLTKGSEKNVKGLHAAPLSNPVTSFGATAMAHTHASATPAKSNFDWKIFAAEVENGSIIRNKGRSYHTTSPAQKSAQDKGGGSRSRRQRQRRRSARNRTTIRCRRRRNRTARIG